MKANAPTIVGAFAICLASGISTNALAADTLLDWSTATVTDLEAGASTETRDGITVTTTGAKFGGRTSDTLLVTTATSNGFAGVISSAIDADADDESDFNRFQFTFSEPVYNLSFQVNDIDSSNSGGTLFTDLIVFGSNGGLPTAGVVGSAANVSYDLATGRAISNSITNCQAANSNLCTVTVTFANPLTVATVDQVSADVIGVAGVQNTSNQAVQIFDLTFNTPPDATNNTSATAVGLSVSGNVVTDNDGSGVDSDRQDGVNVSVNQISHPTGGTSAVGPAGTTLTLANGATLTIAQDGSYTFNPNGAYVGLGPGASTTETFTYRIEDLEGLFNTNGDTPNPDSVATLVVTISNTPISSFTLNKVVDQASITAPGTLNYTMTVANTGNTALTSPTLNDTLLQSGSPLTLTSGPTGPTGDAGTLGVLDVGEIWTYTATYNVTTANINDGGDILNVATFDTAETAPETSSASTTTPGPTIACAGDNFPGNAISGASGSTICSTTGATGEAGEPNPTGGARESIWYTWTAPLTGTAEFNTCDVATTNYDTTIGVYTGGAVNTLATVIENDDGTGCANFSSRLSFAAVAGTTYRIAVDGYQNNDGTFKLDWSMVAPSAAITKSVDKTSVGNTDTLNYTIIVDNDGTQALNAPVLDDVVTQNGATRQSVSGVTLSSGDTDLDGVLDTNETWIYTVSYPVTATDLTDGNDLLNTASFTSTETPTAITATATTTIDEADLSLAKSVNPASIVAGGPVTFTLTLTNDGPATSIGVTVTDVVPAGFSVTGTSTASGSASNTGNTVTWTPADLANGASATLDITATAVTAGPYTNAAEVTASGLPDPDSSPNDSTGDDYATVGVTIIAANPSTSIVKTAALVKAPGNSGADAEVGDTINYTFIVTNTGNTVLTDVDVEDNDATHSGSGPLPNPLEDAAIVTDAAPTGDSTDATPGNGIWSQLGPGDVIRFTTSYTVTQEDVDAQ